MGVIKDSLEQIRSYIESVDSYPTYTGEMDVQNSDPVVVLVQLDDQNPFNKSGKTRSFNSLITFRIDLDYIGASPEFEDDGQDIVFKYLNLLDETSIAGIRLSFRRSQFSKDDQSRYLGSMLFETWLQDGSLNC